MFYTSWILCVVLILLFGFMIDGVGDASRVTAYALF
ncbi:MAG: hypothetical protein G01um101433_847 [Parcubacteria group bacterium Gr01-1014_33]|nr:MAG: hypothetical protein G01um101433_847 [Parcubacteria group bacterium Gr01-1014_33]